MPFLTQGKTNWKFLLIVIILAVIVGGGIFWYSIIPKNVPSESDSGYDIYNKGIVSGYIKKGNLYYKGNFLGPGFYTLEDYCYIVNSDKQSSSGDHLKEYVLLDDDTISFGDRRCNCVDGACIKPASVDICTDTDGGNDIYTKGRVIGIHKHENFISESEDRCTGSGSMLLENFCTVGINYDYNWVPCEGGCEDGRCLKGTPSFLPDDWPINKCYDSDGGENYYQKGETYGNYDGDVFDSFVVMKDFCQNENQLNEHYCVNDTRSTSKGIKCPCADGVCILINR